MEDRATGNGGAVRLAEQDDERTGGEHDDFDGLCHTQGFHRTVCLGKCRAERFGNTQNNNQHGGNQENGKRAFCRAFARAAFHFAFRDLGGIDFLIGRVFQAALVFRVILQLLAHLVDEDTGDTNAKYRGWNRYHENIQHGYMVWLQNMRCGNNGNGNRAGNDGELRGNDRHRQRSFRTDAVTARHFGNHRQHGIGDVAGTGKDGENVGNNRRHEGDVFRVFAQNATRNLDHQVETAGGLHR